MERKSNIEIIRILAMFLIVGYHMITNGLVDSSFSYWNEGTLFNKIIASALFPAGRIGVMLFFMITGYFLFDKDKVSIKKVLYKSLFYIYFTSILFIILQLSIGIYETGEIDSWKLFIFKNIFTPISSGNNWFVTFYILLLFIIPALNPFLHSLDKKQFLLILIFAILISFGINNIFGGIYDYLIQALLYYSYGFFYKKYISSKKNIVLGIIVFIFISIISIYFSYLYFYFQTNSYKYSFIIHYFIKTFCVTITSLSIFYIFDSFKNINNKCINKLATATLSVYLLHGSIFQQFLWNNIVKVKKIYNLNSFPLLLLLWILIIYFICFIIDSLINKLFFRNIQKREKA